jgi:hypothetical protein
MPVNFTSAFVHLGQKLESWGDELLVTAIWMCIVK